MKNDELGSFLQSRGIPHHNRKEEERIVLASIANKMDISVRPSVEEIRSCITDDKQSLLTLKNGVIKLPDPDLLTRSRSRLECQPSKPANNN